MKFEQIKNPTKKLAKGFVGIFVIKLVILAVILVVQSCQKESLPQSKNQLKAKENFLKALQKNQKVISSNLVTHSMYNKVENFSTGNTTSSAYNDEVYLNIPSQVTDEIQYSYDNINSIQSLSNFLIETDATIQYLPSETNCNYSLGINTQTVNVNLQPLVQDSKEFLYSKGFSEEEIQQMLLEENAPEIDLITLSMVIIENEMTYPIAKNSSDLFINSSYARDIDWGEVGHCAVHAIGIDLLFSLGSSGAVAWSRATIKAAFKKVASRMMGPIGVTIAVVDFGFCMAGVEL